MLEQHCYELSSPGVPVAEPENSGFEAKLRIANAERWLGLK